jgi:hypothetical protein
MGRGIAEGCMDPQHIYFQSNKLHTFQTLVRGGASNTGGNKILRHKNKARGHLQPTEAESKHLLEPERMKAVENLQAYQNEMRAWRDKKVKEKTIEVGDLVLLLSPCTEASSKWNQNEPDLS